MSVFHASPATVPLSPGRPLLIVDADEVILRFAEGLDQYLRRRGLFLDLTSYRLHGNVKRFDDKSPVLDVEVTALLEDFRSELDWLEAVEHSRETLGELRARMDIVVLSNVSETQAPPRAKNLAAHGFD